MSNTFQRIDVAQWKRKIHCQIFKKAVQPHYCIAFELDVTNFTSYIKDMNCSFTFAFIYSVTKCANELDEFKCRFVGDDVVLYESVDTTFTYLDKGTELFKVVTVPMQESLGDYVRLARTTAENQKEYFPGPVRDDVFIFSALPWITFTNVSHIYFGDGEKAQPVFDWGKYSEKDGKVLLPFSVQVHHSFVDGIHIGRLATNLQNYLDALGR